MSEKEEEYSAYMTFHSQYITVFALFGGFIFAAIVVILAEYPNVGQIHAQAALLALNLVLDLCLYELWGEIHTLMNCVRVAPKIPPRVARRHQELELSMVWILLGAVVPMLFLLWNLLYLSLASAIITVLTIIAGYRVGKPFIEPWKQNQWVRK